MQTNFQGSCSVGGLWIPGKGMGVLHNLQKFRVRVWNSYRTSEVLGGYGYACRTELPEVPGTGIKVLQNFQKIRVLWHESRTGMKMLSRTPDICGIGVQNLQKSRVRVINTQVNTQPRGRSSI